jgi:hypothetical protein
MSLAAVHRKSGLIVLLQCIHVNSRAVSEMALMIVMIVVSTGKFFMIQVGADSSVSYFT